MSKHTVEVEDKTANSNASNKVKQISVSKINDFLKLKDQITGTFVAIKLFDNERFTMGKIKAMADRLVIVDIGYKHVIVQEKDFRLFDDFIYLIISTNV